MKTIGQRIKAQRLALGITKQEDLAKAVGLDQSSISGIERHNVGFTAATLMKFSKVLGLTPEYIMEGSPSENLGEVEIVAIYRLIAPDERATLLRMARALVTETPVQKQKAA